MQKITPFLWFDKQAEEAMIFYTSIFKNSGIISVRRYSKNEPGSEGGLMAGTFQLEGQEFMAINGGPVFNFTEAISLYVSCKSQKEVDYYWKTLSMGGKKEQCGWLKDKFGISWQIVPTILGELLGDPDAKKSYRVLQAMLKMTKLQIDKLQAAYDNA